MPASARSSGFARRIPASIPFIADAKRGDIGSTAARQAVALFDVLGADAVTLNPYLGRDALAPFLERDDRFVYVLCRTSNPGAAEFQNLDRERRAALRSRRAPRPRVGGRGGEPPDWLWAQRRRTSLSAFASGARTCPSSCRASAPRVATSRPCWQAARSRAGSRPRRSRWRAAGQRLARRSPLGGRLERSGDRFEADRAGRTGRALLQC